MSITKKDKKRARAVMAQFEKDEAERMAMRKACTLQPKMIEYLNSDEGKADIKSFIADRLSKLSKLFGVKLWWNTTKTTKMHNANTATTTTK